MADLQVIKLTADGEGTTTVNLTDIVVQLITRFNYSAACWEMDVLDIDDNVLVAGLMLVPNVDILIPYLQLKEQLGGFLIIEKTAGDYQKDDSLGTTVFLLWFSPGTDVEIPE